METSSSPPADDNAPAKPEIKCLYTKACDTGSQPRKAISHIFGRNKMCTRMIPQHVWVHFCRKHYQRSRYRNAQEYAKVQCELVEKQVARVQSWSDDNRRAGQGDVVVDWSLSMRKREQTRVQEQAHKKRTSGQESEDDTGMDRAVLNGTAVPDWLRNKVGDGYSTDEIQQIVLRLKEEVEQNNMSQIPDIEILPNITDIQDGSRNKATLKRKAAISSTHRRSQSAGDALRPESQPVSRRVNESTYDIPEDELRTSPAEKRRRIHGVPTLAERSGLTIPEVPERTRPATMRAPRHQQSMIATSRDDLVDTRDHYGSLLPSPISQRTPYGFTMASGLESFPAPPEYPGVRRPSHMRSHSDAYRNSNYPPFSSYSEHQQYPQSYDTSPSTYERSYMTPNNFSPPTSSHSGYYSQHQTPIPPIRSHDSQSFWASPSGHSPSNALRHGRHQSSPSLQHQMPLPPAPEYNSVPSPSRPASNYEHRSYSNRRHDSFAPQRQYNYRPIVEESEKTKALYSERR